MDKDGEVVPYDRYGFIRGGDSNWIIVCLSPFRDYSIDKFGIPFDVPQGSLNVVFPGETPYLPGFGPLIGFPVNAFLNNRPDAQSFFVTSWAKPFTRTSSRSAELKRTR